MVNLAKNYFFKLPLLIFASLVILFPRATLSQGFLQGDLDKDGDVDIFDYNILVENFGSTNCGNVADIDGNCKVDIFDYNILVENFGLKATPTPTRTPTPTSIPSSPSPPSPPPSGSGHTYPRTAAMTFGLDSDSVTMNHYAQFDIVMARNDSPGFITQLRALNPSLEYLVNEDVNCGDNWFRNKPNEWMLHDSKGNQTGVDYCRGGVSPNLSDIGLRSNGKLYVEAFAEEAAQRVLSSGADGFMTDGLYYTGHYSWYTPDDIDLDRNGLNDMTEPGKGKSWFLNHWKAGIDSMISEIRNRIGADRLIIVNTGSQDCPTCSQINGLYFENTGGEINWSYSRSTALNLQSQAYPPPTFVMNLSFDPRNDQRPPGPTYFDYQYMRFGLCRALLLGEYFEPEAWEAGEHTWSEWYDEMSLDLGYPRGNMVEIAPGVWARIFTRGATICNLNGSPVSVNDSQLRLAQGYSGPYYRFRGCQDPTLNNGQQFTSLSLKGHRYIGYGNAEITVGDGVVVVDGPGISSCPDNPCPPGGYWRDGQCAR